MLSLLIVLVVRKYYFEVNHQNKEQLYSGDDYSHWFHLSGIVVEKTSDTLLVELTDEKESARFFDTTEVSLDCTRCKNELENISKGEAIRFYFFKGNIADGTVKAEKIVSH